MKPTIPEVVPLFAAYFQKAGNGVWGSLHCVLDDKNVSNSDVEYARFYAAEQHDEDGQKLANILSRMSRTQRIKLPNAVAEYIEKRVNVMPPNEHIRLCGMHWLRAHRYGSADNGGELVALQWNPGSKTWSHSNSHDTNASPIDTAGWDYIAPIPWPAI